MRQLNGLRFRTMAERYHVKESMMLVGAVDLVTLYDHGEGIYVAGSTSLTRPNGGVDLRSA